MAKKLPGWAKVLIGVALVGAPVAAIVALGPGRSGPAADTAVVQASQEPDVLNPYLSPMAASGALSALFYSGLVTLDENGEWAPDLALAVPTVENGLVKLDGKGMVVTYRLRNDARWHDGSIVTASDVVATWRLLTDPAFPAVSTAGYELVTDVKVRTPRDVEVHFKEPYAPYLELFPFIFPAWGIGEPATAARASWNRQPMGTGPYRFDRWVSGDRLVAVANAGYFRGKPAIPRLEVRFVPQEHTALQMWRTGAVDLLQGAPPTQYELFQREAPDQLHLTPSGAWEHLAFNLEHPILKDVRVRRAIAHLIDRHQLNTKAYGGVLLPAWSELPTSHWAFHRPVEKRYMPDAAAAARLLDEAGWKRGPDGIRRLGDRELALTLLTTSEKPSRSLAAQIFQRQWREAGFRLTIDKQPASLVFGSAASGGRLASGDFDMALISSLSRPDPDSTFRWRSDQVPPHGQNRSRYRDPEVDRLLLAGQRALARPERQAIYARLAERLITDLPVLPLLYWVDVDATRPRLTGFKPNPTLRGNLWNVWEWKLVDPS